MLYLYLRIKGGISIMRNILLKMLFIVVLIFCFMVIEVSAYDSDYDIYINDEEISNYDLINWNDNDCVLDIRDIVGIGNDGTSSSCDIFNRCIKNNDVMFGDDEINSSKKIIVLLMILIIISLIYLIIFDKNE